MYNRKIIFSVLMLLAMLVCIVWIVVIFGKKQSGLVVTFFNVGQGDAILISQGSQQILIDGGRDGGILLEKLGRAIPFWDREIEVIIATHPDADHISGLIDVAKAYQIGSVMETDFESDSQTYKSWRDVIMKEGSERIEAEAGEKVILRDGAELDILYPFSNISDVDEKNSNAASVVARLSYGENSFLFTGDLPSEQEEILLKSPFAPIDDTLAPDSRLLRVLKVGHHGSKYSTSDALLDAFKPKDAIISVGAHNQYGHPNQETLDRLLRHRANIIRTDASGDIMYKCKNKESACAVFVEE